jgi:hypothetical protein
MTVSPVSKAAAFANTADLALENRISAIDQKIADIQQRIQDTFLDKQLTAEAKNERVQGFRELIQELQGQKREIQADARKIRREQAEREREREREQQKSGQAAEPSARGLSDQKTHNALAMANVSRKQQLALAPVRSRMETEMKTAERSSYTRREDPVKAAGLRYRIARADTHVIRTAKEVLEETRGDSYRSYIEEEEKQNRGTGRWETGQFMDGEA